MFLLLPPSESKSQGGTGPSLSVNDLRFDSELRQFRNRVAASLIELSHDRDTAVVSLKLGPRQGDEVLLNQRLFSAPTLPALTRYTGVLYEAVTEHNLDKPARDWISEHVGIQSSLFGLIGAFDRIPAYRMSATTRLPLTMASGSSVSLTYFWREAHRNVFDNSSFLIDARSESYRALAPLPSTETRDDRSIYVRVVSRSDAGQIRALNHFNKKAKGELMRRLAQDRPDIENTRDVIDWCLSCGWRARHDQGAGELILEIPATSQT